jgi:hypothetical protein
VSDLDLSPLQALTDARGRPALFFLVDEEPIHRGPVVALHDELAGRSFDELDLVIHSGGGSAHAAYQAMTLMRLHAKTIYGCVPFWAKSAATLLCIGADRIILGEHAELGPLDVQIYEEKEAGKGEYHSALDPFKALEQLQSFSVEALSSAMRFIVPNYGMSYDDSLRHAVAFVNVTTGPLIGRLDPEKIGQYSRELAVATEYGARLLRRCSKWPPKKINEVVDQLVYGYPSHEYIIDYHELRTLGFDVGLFADDEREAVSALRPFVEGLEGSIIRLLEPSHKLTDNNISVSAIADGRVKTQTDNDMAAMANEQS